MRTNDIPLSLRGLMPEIVTQNILVKIWEKAAKKYTRKYEAYM